MQPGQPRATQATPDFNVLQLFFDNLPGHDRLPLLGSGLECFISYLVFPAGIELKLFDHRVGQGMAE